MTIASAQEALALYQERINAHDFDELVPLISAGAVFWFNDGSHVGLDAVRAAFERTWAQFDDETYWLDDVQWLATSGAAAACRYRFHWRATVSGVVQSGHGRGTTVLACGAEGWQIVHEHLSAEPKLVEKVCPVVLREAGNGIEILAFRHPLAGVQLVKGTREPDETIEAGALRELEEESGIGSGTVVADLGSSDGIDAGQRWHFVQVDVPILAEQWSHDTADDGGHRFEFFWRRLDDEPGPDWHYCFGHALQHIRVALKARQTQTR